MLNDKSKMTKQSHHNSQIANTEVGAFSGLSELRVLRLDDNLVDDINGLVSHLGKLQWLNVSSNR